MADRELTKVCEAEGNACKKEIRALCFHCSKNLCRIHLVEHTQLIEENTRAELNSLGNKFNELSSKFNDLAISENILQEPFAELEYWRLKAHEKIDQLAEKKRQEINENIDKYRKLFAINNNEQMEKVNASKKMIGELIQDADASSRQIADLQACIDATERYLTSLDTHKIGIQIRPPIWPAHVYTQAFLDQPTPAKKLREFKITYIRLNGIIRHYFLMINKDGTMKDLIEVFVQEYPLLEAIARFEADATFMIQHQPESDSILSVEVYDCHIRKQYSNDHQIVLILSDESVVFYETPHSLTDQSNPSILMPCNFRRPPHKKLFGWPIYLSVLREGCQGHHIRDALLNLIGIFFPLDSHTDVDRWEALLQTTVNYSSKETKLNDVLQDKLDFGKTSVTLFVNIPTEIADEYELNALK